MTAHLRAVHGWGNSGNTPNNSAAIVAAAVSAASPMPQMGQMPLPLPKELQASLERNQAQFPSFPTANLQPGIFSTPNLPGPSRNLQDSQREISNIGSAMADAVAAARAAAQAAAATAASQMSPRPVSVNVN